MRISLLLPGRPGAVMLSEDLPKEPTAPARARRMLDALADEVPRSRLDDARLLLSELVSNAVEHVDAEGSIRVSVRFDDNLLRVDVADPGSGFSPRERDPQSVRGWGLQFVRALSDRWGVESAASGHVWFELTA